MFPFLKIIPLMVGQLILMLFNPIFWIVVVIVAIQYRRIAGMRGEMFGSPGQKPYMDMLYAVGFGLIGGLVGSFFMVFVGVTLSGSGLIYLWPIAIFLMLVNPRFLCFAYAGGILSLSKLLLGFPDVKVSQILALIAILHMVESILIYFSGHLGAVPIYLRLKENGNRIVGGFTLQKFWPIPIIALIVMTGVTGGGVEMPEWWPLISPGVGDLKDVTLGLIPVVAGLGYADIVTARTPKEKSRLSAGYLGIYSFVLLALAVMAEHSMTIAIVAALFSPLGHELVIHIGRNIEFNAEPIYVPPGRGVKVLDILQAGPAWKAGLRSGDVILSASGYEVETISELDDLLDGGYGFTELAYLRDGERGHGKAVVPVPSASKELGMLCVPEGDTKGVVELMTGGFLSRWWDSIMAKIKG
ncbi:MAG TPA: PDZ domain-containing protein [Clostridia bacterium]|nr:PDZ domain-containing protein [Clostridia bacterium]